MGNGSWHLAAWKGVGGGRSLSKISKKNTELREEGGGKKAAVLHTGCEPELAQCSLKERARRALVPEARDLVEGFRTSGEG